MKTDNKRAVEIAVISDVHLGTYGCRAKELLHYLKSINPEILVLNGDIIDIWQFNKRYWPKSHMKIVKYLTKLLGQGKQIYYITGNHDEMLRRFNGFELGGLKIVNKLCLNLNGEQTWIFHGDVFDVTMQHSKWLAKLGAVGYDMLILINTMVNYISALMGQGKLSLSKKIKNSVKSAVKHINNFEQTAADIAIENTFDYVICGHIHQPVIRTVSNEKGSVTYLNSGDWIENCTALEYYDKKWHLFHHIQDDKGTDTEEHQFEIDSNYDVIFSELIKEINPLTANQ